MEQEPARENCSIQACVNQATHSEFGEVGHWFVTIFFCDEHARQLREGTPVGPAGIDPSTVRVEAIETNTPAHTPGRFPSIA
jgi:hypothetical protein